MTLGITTAYAQQASTASGGNASGSGGSASYSVGQTAYTVSNGNGSVSQGVQQPFEISIVTDIGIKPSALQFSSMYGNISMVVNLTSTTSLTVNGDLVDWGTPTSASYTGTYSLFNLTKLY